MNQKNKSNLLFKKYSILSKIDEGSFGLIYLAKNKFTNEKVAIKVENRKKYKPLLEREAYILFYLKGPGLPEIKTFGKTREYFILVQTLLGPSLSALIDNYLIKFTIKDICMLSIQMIERLEYIHSKNFIHRDIKPHNFLMGLDDPNMLYIIDFGLSKKYRSKKGNHIKFSITNNITGTPRYCSINALRGAEQSRRDDLESLFYVILYFFRGSVPWQNLKIKSRSERFNKINEIKKKIDYKYLCKNLPEEVYNFGVYVKNLKFEQEPNYKYMKKLFYLILSKIKEIDDDKFSWINNQNIITSKNNSHSRQNIFKDKPSIHQRLYEKITNSLEKKILIQNNNNNLKNQNIKDNITLVSLNIENNKSNIKNKIKKSSSYIGANDIRVRYLMNKKNKNLFAKDINNIKDNLINNKNIYNSYNNYNYNKGVIKRNSTAIKTVKINKILNEDMRNINNNEYNIFNINNNEFIKNFFLRNNKVYTSPNLILDIKQLDNSNSNSNSNLIIKSNKKVISKNNSEIILKSKNKKIINKNINPNYNNDISYFSNNNNNNNNNNKNYKKINNLKTKYNVNINKNINNNINSKSSNNNITNSNIMNITNSINNTTSSKFSNKNYLLTYNSEAIPKINLNLELEKRVKVNSTTFPITNLYLNQNQINLTPKSTNRRKNNIKNRSQKNRIKLNIKLINNNNYNNVPLMIYNTYSNKLNNIKNNIDTKNIKTKYRNAINNNINKNQNNPSRIIKYTIQRKTKTNHENNYDDEQYFQNGDDFHNKIKIMTIPKHKTQLD